MTGMLPADESWYVTAAAATADDDDDDDDGQVYYCQWYYSLCNAYITLLC